MNYKSEVLIFKFIILLLSVFLFIMSLGCGKTEKKPNVSIIPTATPTIEYVIAYQQGVSPVAYAGTKDNCIINLYPYDNFGNYGELSVGNVGNIYRMLLKFDITTGIPTGAKITRAELTVFNDNYQVGNSINVYAITSDWDETTSSWNKRNSVDNWLNPGGDYGALIATEFFGEEVENTFLIDTAIIDSWINTPSSNYGMILMSADESKAGYTNIYSSNYSNPNLRPILKIYYILP